MSQARRHIGFMIFASFAILIAGRIYRITRPPTPQEILAPLQEELAAFRSSADSCNTRYGIVEARFRAVDQRIDSLRGVVLRYESMDPAGVPGDQYAEYLEAFDAYNEAVPEWEVRADSVELLHARCRLMTEGHNELADSLRTQLVEYGLWPSDSLRAQWDSAALDRQDAAEETN
jgi:hypothetical protein